jgi:hypothetical protein
MMDKMKKMLEKKKGHKLSDVERDAKMSVVNNMKDMASSMMGDHIKGLKKVTVASDSKEGLQSGLDKAKDLMDQYSEDGHSSMDDNENAMEQKPEHEVHDSGDGETGKEDSPEDMDERQEESMESPEEEKAEEDSGEEDHEDMDDEELNKKLEHLMNIKKKKEAKKHK